MENGNGRGELIERLSIIHVYGKQEADHMIN